MIARSCRIGKMGDDNQKVLTFNYKMKKYSMVIIVGLERFLSLSLSFSVFLKISTEKPSCALLVCLKNKQGAPQCIQVQV